MPQDIRTGSPFNSKVPLLTDTADIVKALKDYHYGVESYPSTDNAENNLTTGIVGMLNTKAPKASPTFTGTVVLPSTTSIGNVTNTEISYLDGVTSAIQTQLDTKAPKSNPEFTGIVYKAQGNTTTQSTATTLTLAQLKSLIITSTPTATIAFTLPAASTMDIPADNLSFEWSIINLATPTAITGTITTAQFNSYFNDKRITFTNGTNHTYVGSAVLAGTSARFRTRRVSSSNYTTYRIS